MRKAKNILFSEKHKCAEHAQREFQKNTSAQRREIYFLVKNTSAQSTHSVNFKKTQVRKAKNILFSEKHKCAEHAQHEFQKTQVRKYEKVYFEEKHACINVKKIEKHAVRARVKREKKNLGELLQKV